MQKKKESVIIIIIQADVAELVDALDLGSSRISCESSSLSVRKKLMVL